MEPTLSSLNLTVNRLSGSPSNSLRYTNSTVNILDGNLFACPLLTNDIANSDGTEKTCGSADTDVPFYMWLATFIAIFLFGLLSRSERFRVSVTRDFSQLITKWIESSYRCTSLHACNFITKQEYICSMSALLSLFFTLLVMMSYIGLKLSGDQTNAVYKVQYLYTTTAAFFVGASPAVMIWIYLTVSGLLVVMQCIVTTPSRLLDTESTNRIEVEKEDHRELLVAQDKMQKLTTQCLVSLFFVIVALAINYGYLNIVYFKSSKNLPLVQLLFGLIKTIFSMVVRLVSKRIRKSFRQKFSIIISSIVLIIAPALVVVVTSPDCLRNLIEKTSITEFYQYNQKDCSSLGHCFLVVVHASRLFTPPWSYSYTCSSSFFTSYLPNFVWFYFLNGIIFPALDLACMILLTSTKYSNHWLFSCFVFVTSFFDKIFYVSSKVKSKDVQVEMRVSHSNIHQESSVQISNSSSSNISSRSSTSDFNKFKIDVSEHIPSLCLDITLLLTFGLASPLLAILISFSIFISTLKMRIGIGRYIYIVEKELGPSPCYLHLESAFNGTWQTLSDSWWFMSIFIGLFWSFFIFDMIGDRNVTAGALSAVFMFLWCPLVFWGAQFLLEIKADTKSTLKQYLAGLVLKIAKYIHEFIWINILQMDKLIKRSDDVDKNIERISTISETVSPLGR